MVILGSGSLTLPVKIYLQEKDTLRSPAWTFWKAYLVINFISTPYCSEASAVSVSEIRTEELEFLPLAFVDFWRRPLILTYFV